MAVAEDYAAWLAERDDVSYAGMLQRLGLEDLEALDDEVDALYWSIFRELIKFMADDSESIKYAIDLILIARFIERIADQATNISEEVVYLVEAQPIRHIDEEDWDD